MKKIVPTPCYSLKVKFKNIEKAMFFYVTEDECFDIQEKLRCVSSKNFFLDITDIQQNSIYINLTKLQSIYFLYEVHPFEIEVEDEIWAIEIQLNNMEKDYIEADSPETYQALYDSIYKKMPDGSYPHHFFEFTDLDDETFFFNRDEVVYFKISHECFDDFEDSDID